MFGLLTLISFTLKKQGKLLSVIPWGESVIMLKELGKVIVVRNAHPDADLVDFFIIVGQHGSGLFHPEPQNIIPDRCVKMLFP